MVSMACWQMPSLGLPGTVLDVLVARQCSDKHAKAVVQFVDAPWCVLV